MTLKAGEGDHIGYVSIVFNLVYYHRCDKYWTIKVFGRVGGKDYIFSPRIFFSAFIWFILFIKTAVLLNNFAPIKQIEFRIKCFLENQWFEILI